MRGRVLQKLFAVLLCCFCTGPSFVTAQFKRVCYINGRARERVETVRFEIQDVDPFLCTHLVYAFAGFDTRGRLQPLHDSTDVDSYKELNGLRQRNPVLKTLLAVGGWRFGSQKFSLVADDLSTRQTFVSSAVAFLREHAFDGLVLDWQYPGYRNGNARDRQNLVALCKELRQAFEDEATGDKRLLLAAASPASRSHLDAGYDVAALTRYLDQWHLMTFNYHGPWDRTTGHNSPLLASSQDTGLALTRNIAWTANEYVTRGAPRDKVLLGLSTYARAFTLENLLHTSPGSKATIAPSSNYTQEPGFLAYYEVCKIVSEPDANVFLDNEQRAPYLVKKNLWISFDDVNSTKEKAQWLKQQGFGGFVAWTLDTDSFHPDLCNSQSKKDVFLLISAAAAVLLDSAQPGASTSSSLHAVSTSSTTPLLLHSTPAPVTSPPLGVVRAETTTETATTAPSSMVFSCEGRPWRNYPHPTSQCRFIVCWADHMYIRECPNSSLYNHNTGTCDLPRQGKVTC